MEFVSATDAKNSLGAIIEKAQRGPVTIRKQNRDAAVILSPHDYQRLTSLNAQEFLAFREAVSDEAERRGLTPEILQEILSKKP